jgi:hypothetical protein
MFSAWSSTSMIGSASDRTLRTRMGGSAGLTFLKVGGLGRLVGSCPDAAVMADWTSCAAPSMLRPRSNWTVICVLPRVLDEVSCRTPGIEPSCFSSGVATAEAITSGLAPGSDTET